MILASTNILKFRYVRHVLDTKFKIKDLGELKHFLGFMKRSSKGISLLQRKYCIDLLQETCILESKLGTTPTDPTHDLHSDLGNLLPDSSQFRSLISNLISLTHYRHDISFPIYILSQCLSQRTTTHIQESLHIARYLNYSPATSLRFQATSIQTTTIS